MRADKPYEEDGLPTFGNLTVTIFTYSILI